MRKLLISVVISFFCLVWAGSAAAASIGGKLYWDANQNARTLNYQRHDWRDKPLADVYLEMLGPDYLRVSKTNDDGDFVFFDVPDGAYLVDVQLDDTREPVCTSHNQPHHLREAIDAGRIKMVAFGDSNSVFGSDKPYPQWVAEYLSNFAEVELTNVAVLGSQTIHWVPGGAFWGNLEPLLADADLITFTLIGNDFWDHFGTPPFTWEELWAKIQSFPAVYEQALANISDIVEEIRSYNPDVDIVYVVYPIFSNSSLWRDLVGAEMWPLFRLVNAGIFGDIRRRESQNDELLLADMMGYFPLDLLLDEYLFDQIHPNDLGHRLYGEQVFAALGGAIIEDGEAVVGGHRLWGFAPEESPTDLSLVHW